MKAGEVKIPRALSKDTSKFENLFSQTNFQCDDDLARCSNAKQHRHYRIMFDPRKVSEMVMDNDKEQ